MNAPKKWGELKTEERHVILAASRAWPDVDVTEFQWLKTGDDPSVRAPWNGYWHGTLSLLPLTWEELKSRELIHLAITKDELRFLIKVVAGDWNKTPDNSDGEHRKMHAKLLSLLGAEG